MSATYPLPLTFGCLMFAVGALWLPPLRVGRHTLPAWCIPYTVSIVCGLVQGYLTWIALVSLAAFFAIAFAAARLQCQRVIRSCLLVATGCLALAMAMHKLPGFTQATLAENVQFSPGAPAASQRASFDLISAGLIIAALFCHPVRGVSTWIALLRNCAALVVLTLAAVLGIACTVGYVALDLKWPAYTALFLATNLLFTCMTEEAFFRGFMQEQLGRALSGTRRGCWLALFASAILFGLAHMKGGAMLVALATMAGCAYGYGYLRTGRIEASILVHFSLNAVHFVAFTYPHLAK